MSDWQHFSVEEFFSQNNWSGKAQENGDLVIQEIPWLCQKIEEFLSQSNWQGELIAELNNPEFSMTLSVNEFFIFFDWESNYKIAFQPESETIWESYSVSEDELKVDNFGDLF